MTETALPWRRGRAYIIAEAGVNHDGDPDRALALVAAGAAAGADAVKFQTFRPEALAVPDAPLAGYQKAGEASGSQVEMLRRLALPEHVFKTLRTACAKAGVDFLSTPFDEESAAFLAPMVPAIKIGSGEITNTPFLDAVAWLGRPVILSTGMATLGEIEQAVETLKKRLEPENIALLHCVSRYPAPPEAANLRFMGTLRRAFGLSVGFSDHTEGWAVAPAAVALGAVIVEKHFTLDRNLPGPDHKASLEPEELAAMIRHIRTVEQALGSSVRTVSPEEREVALAARRGLYAARDIAAGERIGASDVAALRPERGLRPFDRERVVGKIAAVPITRGTPLEWRMLQ